MKTIKEIAEELGVNKQKVYRYIKRHCISEAHQCNGVMYYDDAAESQIKSGLFENTASREVHHDAVTDALVEALRGELKVKNEQIQELNDRLAETTAALVTAQQTAQAAQALHAGTIRKQLAGGEEDSPGFFSRIFKRKEK